MFSGPVSAADEETGIGLASGLEGESGLVATEGDDISGN
jgi:hypothetical protein